MRSHPSNSNGRRMRQILRNKRRQLPRGNRRNRRRTLTRRRNSGMTLLIGVESTGNGIRGKQKHGERRQRRRRKYNIRPTSPLLHLLRLNQTTNGFPRGTLSSAPPRRRRRDTTRRRPNPTMRGTRGTPINHGVRYRGNGRQRQQGGKFRRHGSRKHGKTGITGTFRRTPPRFRHSRLIRPTCRHRFRPTYSFPLVFL